VSLQFLEFPESGTETGHSHLFSSARRLCLKSYYYETSDFLPGQPTSEFKRRPDRVRHNPPCIHSILELRTCPKSVHSVSREAERWGDFKEFNRRAYPVTAMSSRASAATRSYPDAKMVLFAMPQLPDRSGIGVPADHLRSIQKSRSKIFNERHGGRSYCGIMLRNSIENYL
jgi:hypothetical protein